MGGEYFTRGLAWIALAWLGFRGLVFWVVAGTRPGGLFGKVKRAMADKSTVANLEGVKEPLSGLECQALRHSIYSLSDTEIAQSLLACLATQSQTSSYGSSIRNYPGATGSRLLPGP